MNGVGGIETERNDAQTESLILNNWVANFYQWFIQDFSHVAKPLHKLTKKEWCGNGPKTNRWLEELKQLITSTPILYSLTNMCSSNWRWMLLLCHRSSSSQLCDDPKWYPVGFTIQESFQYWENYKIHNKELLSVIWGLEEWRHILEGTKHTIEILNDHRNLTYFQESQNWTSRKHTGPSFARFDLSLIHRPG